MPLISSRVPGGWKDLENSVAAILAECGMTVQQGVRVDLPRGHVDIDVLAEDTVEDISIRTVCECKDWSTNVPQEKVHAFRTVMLEIGAHRGYIITRTGFQAGAIEAARSTNIELLTYDEFQEQYFAKWFRSRIWALEKDLVNFKAYYEPAPWARRGYDLLESDEERAAYDAVWDKYYFAGTLLGVLSPYLHQVMGKRYMAPPLPVNVSMLEEGGYVVPENIRTATGYRELLALLENYGHVGLEELRAHNPEWLSGKVVNEIDGPIPEKYRKMLGFK